MTRALSLFAMLTLCGFAAAACNSPSTTGSATTDETPDPTETPEETPNPTATPTPAPASVIRFVAFGDTGSGSEGQYSVASAINAKCQADGCDFGMILGDNFYNTGVESPTDPQFATKFEQPYGGLGFPIYVVLGNHDYGGDGAGWEFGKGANQVAYAQTHPMFVLPAEYYAFDEGDATFLALGTNLIMWDQNNDEQAQYMNTVLAGSNRPWKIGFGHHPYLSNGKHGNAGEYDGVPWAPIANGAKVKEFFDDHLCDQLDLYLSGHDHSRQILPGTTSCPMTFVVSGAGAKTTDILGSNPNAFQKDTLGFAYIVVSEEKIVIEMLDGAGVLEYTHELLPN